MFDINNISYNQRTAQYACSFQCNSSSDAEYICGKYIMIARTYNIIGTIFNRGATVIIESPSENAVIKIAQYINANYFMPPLDVFVFYGTNRNGVASRWCVGFDFPNASNLIDLLNIQGRFSHVDRDSKSWYDKNGRSYSIVMLTAAMERDSPRENIKKQVDNCLTAIQNVTARQLKCTII